MPKLKIWKSIFVLIAIFPSAYSTVTGTNCALNKYLLNEWVKRGIKKINMYSSVGKFITIFNGNTTTIYFHLIGNLWKVLFRDQIFHALTSSIKINFSYKTPWIYITKIIGYSRLKSLKTRLCFKEMKD